MGKENRMLRFITHNLNKDDQEAWSVMLQEQKEKLAEAQAGEDCYADNQGWLSVEEWASGEKLESILELAGEIRKKAEVFVLIGVGGSNNAARSVIEAFRSERDTYKIRSFLLI